MHPRRLRVVLQDHRHAFAQGVAYLMQIALDLLVRGEPGGRRDHHGGGTGRHGDAGQLRDVRKARIAHPDHDRNGASDAPQGMLDREAQLLEGELWRLAHHAEDGQPVDAGAHVEVDQARQAVEIEGAVVRERVAAMMKTPRALSSSR